MTNEEIIQIIETLDARDRFVLDWIFRYAPIRYDQISGATLDALMKSQLVEMKPISGSRPSWPVSCSATGSEVAKFLQTYKTRRA
jgi:hypothetical protein